LGKAVVRGGEREGASGALAEVLEEVGAGPPSHPSSSSGAIPLRFISLGKNRVGKAVVRGGATEGASGASEEVPEDVGGEDLVGTSGVQEQTLEGVDSAPRLSTFRSTGADCLRLVAGSAAMEAPVAVDAEVGAVTAAAISTVPVVAACVMAAQAHWSGRLQEACIGHLISVGEVTAVAEHSQFAVADAAAVAVHVADAPVEAASPEVESPCTGAS
jgi:hypothetical protein